jgi:hypothetical protein
MSTHLDWVKPSETTISVPLCHDCRFCQPAWWALTIPILSSIPDARRAAWNAAHCRHPTSLERPRWRNYVLGTEGAPT